MESKITTIETDPSEMSLEAICAEINRLEGAHSDQPIEAWYEEGKLQERYDSGLLASDLLEVRKRAATRAIEDAAWVEDTVEEDVTDLRTALQETLGGDSN